MTIKIKLLNDKARLPVRGSEEAAGLDLFITNDEVTMRAGGGFSFSTGISLQLEKGKVGIIKPRSKLAVQHGIDVMAGVIDSDYIGEIMVALVNHSSAPVTLKRGDKVAQLLVIDVSLEEVELVEELKKTERGTKGILDKDVRL